MTIKNHSSPLYIAAQNGHLEIIHILATHKADVHLARKADGCTPFYAAADKGYCEILRCACVRACVRACARARVMYLHLE